MQMSSGKGHACSATSAGFGILGAHEDRSVREHSQHLWPLGDARKIVRICVGGTFNTEISHGVCVASE